MLINSYHSISDTQIGTFTEIQQNLILYIKFKFEIGFNYFYFNKTLLYSIVNVES